MHVDHFIRDRKSFIQFSSISHRQEQIKSFLVWFAVCTQIDVCAESKGSTGSVTSSKYVCNDASTSVNSLIYSGSECSGSPTDTNEDVFANDIVTLDCESDVCGSSQLLNHKHIGCLTDECTDNGGCAESIGYTDVIYVVNQCIKNPYYSSPLNKPNIGTSFNSTKVVCNENAEIKARILYYSDTECQDEIELDESNPDQLDAMRSVLATNRCFGVEGAYIYFEVVCGYPNIGNLLSSFFAIWVHIFIILNA